MSIVTRSIRLSLTPSRACRPTGSHGSEPMLRLTREQVREIDRRSIEEYHIPGIVLMENAAIAATAVAMEMLDGAPDPSVLILCGGGNNGGDGLAVARHLHNHGVRISLTLTVDPGSNKGDALINWKIV